MVNTTHYIAADNKVNIMKILFYVLHEIWMTALLKSICLNLGVFPKLFGLVFGEKPLYCSWNWLITYSNFG